MMHELFVCNCGSPEHQLIVTDFGDGEEVYVEMHLAPLPFWRRFWAGLAYIAGKRSDGGSFEEIVLMPDAAERLANALMRRK